MEALNEDQRTRITWMMIAEHLRCETCGSVQLTCGDTAWEMLGNYMVEVFCNDPEHPDEAPRHFAGARLRAARGGVGEGSRRRDCGHHGRECR